MASFRLSSGRDLLLIVSLQQATESALAADIAFRFVQRLSLASAERLERLFSKADGPEGASGLVPLKVARESPDGLVPSALRTSRVGSALAVGGATALDLVHPTSARPPMVWLRGAMGWSPAPVAPARSPGDE